VSSQLVGIDSIITIQSELESAWNRDLLAESSPEVSQCTVVVSISKQKINKRNAWSSTLVQLQVLIYSPTHYYKFSEAYSPLSTLRRQIPSSHPCSIITISRRWRMCILVSVLGLSASGGGSRRNRSRFSSVICSGERDKRRNNTISM